MRNTVTSPFVVRRNDIALEQLVEREAIRFILHIRVVVFALLADSPAVLAIVALGPPAIQDTTIRLPVERRLLPACPAGLVWAYGIVQPQVRTGNQVACHINIVVFQENNLPPESVTAREAVDLLDQRFARPIGRVRLARENDLHRAPGIVHDAVQAFRVAEDERRPFVCRETPRETDNQGIRVQHTLKLSHLERAFPQAQVMLAQMAARIVNERSFSLHMNPP